MPTAISSIELVSDGLLVHFQGGLCCYYPASFLLDHLHHGVNQIFLNYDPSPRSLSPETMLVEDARASVSDLTLTVC